MLGVQPAPQMDGEAADLQVVKIGRNDPLFIGAGVRKAKIILVSSTSIVEGGSHDVMLKDNASISYK